VPRCPQRLHGACLLDSLKLVTTAIRTKIVVYSRAFGRLAPCALLFACFLVAGGCVNLNDVAQLTKLADSAQQTLPAVVADIPASCQRQNLLLKDIPTDERPPNLLPLDCKPYQDVADHLMKDQDVLIAYFDALGKLASNTPLSYSQTIDTNVSTIEKMPNLSNHTIAASSAAQQIAKVLADAVTRSYRERKVNSIIEKTDGPVQELTADLKKVIVVEYAGILSNESEIMETYYKSPIAAAGKSERLALILVQRQYDNDTTALQSRRAAATAYGKVMDSLASLHAKLKVEATKKANFREIAQEVGPYISSLKDAFSQLQTERK
jgi:hypothetical protein